MALAMRLSVIGLQGFRSVRRSRASGSGGLVRVGGQELSVFLGLGFGVTGWRLCLGPPHLEPKQ